MDDLTYMTITVIERMGKGDGHVGSREIIASYKLKQGYIVWKGASSLVVRVL
ncbi:hypothetical protein DPMN_193779 [Dreissena polymorpha]|uniref:Uncharacterized protein n=1 Tax=Dreissena polymorpha TaxID=45954 RepID=A0A9D3Y681_DREPO|nr:hypothetical protein DPMN_193779 [Dreissena polymorpha]